MPDPQSLQSYAELESRRMVAGRGLAKQGIAIGFGLSH